MPVLYVIGGLVSIGLARLPLRRAPEAGAVLMTAQRVRPARRSTWSSCSRLAKPLGALHGPGLRGPAVGLDRLLGPLERLIYRLAGVDPSAEMTWKTYAVAMLLFNFAGFARRLPAPAPPGRPAAQPAGPRRRHARLVVQHRRQLRHQHELAGLRRRDDDELPHADARADGAELRLGGDGHGGARRAHPRLRAPRRPTTIGNFWVDLTRTHALHPAAALARARARRSSRRASSRPSAPYRARSPLPSTAEPTGRATARPVDASRRASPLGPAASQIAIKQLGTNGGGFFNVNSAHPFENPTPLVELPRGAVDPADPGGALLHVRRAWSATRARAGRSSPR